ncbi:hypothetical protein [Planctomycetes bacterium SV_7m_r]
MSQSLSRRISLASNGTTSYCILYGNLMALVTRSFALRRTHLYIETLLDEKACLTTDPVWRFFFLRKPDFIVR